MKRKRLLWQLFPSYVLITLIAIAAASWFASRELRGVFLQEAAKDLRAKALLLGPIIQQHLDPTDTVTIDRISKDADFRAGNYLTVVLPDGRVAGDSYQAPDKMDNLANRPEIRDAVLTGIGRAIRYSATMDRRIMFISVPPSTHCWWNRRSSICSTMRSNTATTAEGSRSTACWESVSRFGSIRPTRKHCLRILDS